MKTHEPQHRLTVLREERRVEIVARYRRDCEIAKRRAEDDLQHLADQCKYVATLLRTALDQAQAQEVTGP